jgi:D-glycero-D-manno-heptose 1,7-bisphosphate phosphatase
MMNRKAVMLDRDGVLINAEWGKWNNHLSDVTVIQSSIDAVAILNDLGYETFIITNQSGVAKGFQALSDLAEINGFIMRECKKAGGDIRRAYSCIHKPGDKMCDCRKPMPGNILRCAKDFDLDLSQCFFVGDMETDIQAAHNAGCKSVLVLSGLTSPKDSVEGFTDCMPDMIFHNLWDFADYLRVVRDVRIKKQESQGG